VSGNSDRAFKKRDYALNTTLGHAIEASFERRVGAEEPQKQLIWAGPKTALPSQVTAISLSSQGWASVTKFREF